MCPVELHVGAKDSEALARVHLARGAEMFSRLGFGCGPLLVAAELHVSKPSSRPASSQTTCRSMPGLTKRS